MKKLYSIPLLMLAILVFGFNVETDSPVGFLQGKVTTKSSGEELIAANIVVMKERIIVQGASTGIDGNYKIKLDPGTYDVNISYVGFASKEFKKVIIKSDETTKLDVQLDEGVILDEIVTLEYREPIIAMDMTTSGGAVTSAKVRSMPKRDISAMRSKVSGISSTTAPISGTIEVESMEEAVMDDMVIGKKIERIKILSQWQM